MKKVWIAVAVIVALVSVALVYVATRDGEMPYTQNSGQQTDTPQGNEPAADPDQQAEDSNQEEREGQYVDYDEELFASTTGQKWLFFHAPWCPQCRALESDILAKGVPDGLTIFKVDYDTSTQLKQKYGVTLQTTVVEVDDNGNEVDKFVAYDDPSLAAVLNALGD